MGQRKKRSVKCKGVRLEDICSKFPHFHNPASLARRDSQTTIRLDTHFSSLCLHSKWPVAASLRRLYPLKYVQQIYLIMACRDFPWRITSTVGWKVLFRLGRKGSDRIQSLWATTVLKPECDRKGLCFYGFTWKVQCNKGLYSSQILLYLLGNFGATDSVT